MKEIAPVGQFEQLVLTAILALGDNAYGVTIHAKVEELARPRKVAMGAVYATLDRLEDKKLIASWLSEPTKARGGRSRRHYRLEKSGEEALSESAEAAKRIPPDWQAGFSDVPWERLARLGALLRDPGQQVEVDRLWEAVERDVPPLEAVLGDLMGRATADRH